MKCICEVVRKQRTNFRFFFSGLGSTRASSHFELCDWLFKKKIRATCFNQCGSNENKRALLVTNHELENNRWLARVLPRWCVGAEFNLCASLETTLKKFNTRRRCYNLSASLLSSAILFYCCLCSCCYIPTKVKFYCYQPTQQETLILVTQYNTFSTTV